MHSIVPVLQYLVLLELVLWTSSMRLDNVDHITPGATDAQATVEG